MQLRFSWCLVFVPQMQCFYLPVAVKNSCLPAESASPEFPVEFPVFLLFSGFAQLCAPSLFTFKIWFKRGVVGRGEGLSWESACCSGSQHPHTNLARVACTCTGRQTQEGSPTLLPLPGRGWAESSSLPLSDLSCSLRACVWLSGSWLMWFRCCASEKPLSLSRRKSRGLRSSLLGSEQRSKRYFFLFHHCE